MSREHLKDIFISEPWPQPGPLFHCKPLIERIMEATNLKNAYRLTIPGQCPSGKNAVKNTRYGRRYPNERFKAWREFAFLAIRKKNRKIESAGADLSILIKYYPGDRRRRDIPGIKDAIFHVLERSGVVEDDSMFKNAFFITEPLDRENPRVELMIIGGGPYDVASNFIRSLFQRPSASEYR